MSFESQTQSQTFSTSTKKQILISEWKSLYSKLETKLRAQILKYEKLIEKQMKNLMRKMTTNMNVDTNDILYRKDINKIRTN
jgi:hypothetical protein